MAFDNTSLLWVIIGADDEYQVSVQTTDTVASKTLFWLLALQIAIPLLHIYSTYVLTVHTVNCKKGLDFLSEIIFIGMLLKNICKMSCVFKYIFGLFLCHVIIHYFC